MPSVQRRSPWGALWISLAVWLISVAGGTIVLRPWPTASELLAADAASMAEYIRLTFEGRKSLRQFAEDCIARNGVADQLCKIRLELLEEELDKIEDQRFIMGQTVAASGSTDATIPREDCEDHDADDVCDSIDTCASTPRGLPVEDEMENLGCTIEQIAWRCAAADEVNQGHRVFLVSACPDHLTYLCGLSDPLNGWRDSSALACMIWKPPA